MTSQDDYYSILGVSQAASPETVQAAFKDLVKKIPEGKNLADDPYYRKIVKAYKVLSNAERRATYDLLLVEPSPFSLKIDVQTSNDCLPRSNSDQIVYLLVTTSNAEQGIEQGQPLNLCIVIDRSTSMQGERLDRVKTAVELILEKLTPDDVLSVVSFSDRADVVLPAKNVEAVRLLLAQVRGFQASGGTEIYQGLITGVQEMLKVPLSKYVNHLVLLTDGHTYGDVEKCLNLSQEAASLGITFSAMGIGTEWNDQFLDKLVEPSGGKSVFIETPSEIITHLQKEIKSLGQIFAQNIRLSPSLPKYTSLEYAFKLTPFAHPLSIENGLIQLGTIEGQKPLSLLLELKIAPQPDDVRIKLPLHFLVDLPSKQMKNTKFKQTIELRVQSDAPKANPPASVVKAVRLVTIYRMNEKVWDEVKAGDMVRAATRMDQLSTRFLEFGNTTLAQQANSETQRLLNMGTLSEEGRKKLKYGTRSLLNDMIEFEDKND